MNTDGRIIIIEDDADDRELLQEIFNDVLKKHSFENEVIFFCDATQALDYLYELDEKPFLIISDINMPGINGFELRSIISRDDRLRKLCVPYIFLTTSGYDKEAVEKAYSMSVQGYFKKPSEYKEFVSMVTEWIVYWRRSIA